MKTTLRTLRLAGVSAAAQRGIALMMAMIALVAMSLTAMALLRSVDTGNVIAGNLAFRQAAVQAVDVGQEAAFATFQALTGSLDSNLPTGCTSGCSYYSTMQSTSVYDLPTAVDWSAVPVTTTVNGAYEVKVVVDRLCTLPTGVTSVTDQQAQCYVTKLDSKCQQHNPNAITPCNQPPGTYYRATIRVTGPRNTTTFAQASFIRY